MGRKERDLIESFLSEAQIKPGGQRPWDIQIHDERLFSRVWSDGSMGVGESYMQGWWDAIQLDRFFEKVFEAGLHDRIKKSIHTYALFLKNRLLNTQTVKRSLEVGLSHYDCGIDLFERMLDKRLIYSCAYWNKADNLDQAQEEKLDLICRKLQLKPGLRILDIGCGWGGLLQYAAEKYGVEGVGVTISSSQAGYGQKLCRELPVEIRLEDYRNIKEEFDRVVSVGMIEHVGAKNYPRLMKVVDRCLKPDGLFLLHTIGSNYSVSHTDPWIERYIFPNSMLPSLSQLEGAVGPYFRLEDFHSFGPYYDRTLMAWDQNFRNRWHEISDKYDETFYRMWRYYLMSSAASFRVRRIQLWQLLYCPHERKRLVSTVR